LDIGELAAAVTRQAVGRPRILVGIDGPGASGKSTLAGLLAEQLSGAAVVHVDDFHLPSAMGGTRAGEVGALFDLPRLACQVVVPAAGGSALRYQRYDWDRDVLAEWTEVPADAAVIVEGVYCLERRLRDACTYTVFCRCDPVVRLRRGLDRDGERARSMWVDEWMPAEDEYLVREHPDEFANLVVDSSAGTAAGQERFGVSRWAG
jgi:uridine kinase